MNECVARFVNCRPTALLLDIRTKETDYMKETCPRTSMSFINIKISTSKIRAADHGQSHLLPQIPYPLPIILPESASLRYRM